MFYIKYLLAKAALRLSSIFQRGSRFMQNLPMALLSPKELIRMGGIYYNGKKRIDAWSKNALLNLKEYEKKFVEKFNKPDDAILVIGCDGGRESLALAQLGFNVTGIDISKGLIECAKRLANKNSLKINFLNVSLYDFKAPAETFDSIFFSGSSYGMIPTKRIRIEMLKHMKLWLKKKGMLLLSFSYSGQKSYNRYDKLSQVLYKIFSYVVFGNHEIQEGDHIIGEGDFHHSFLSKDEIVEEARNAGFDIEELNTETGAYTYLRSA